VGDSGSIQTSTDGTTWTNRTTANTNAQNAVAYGNGLFVSVGVSGSFQTSTDGTTWINRTAANVSDQNGVTYGDGVFVAVGSSGLLGAIQSTLNTNVNFIAFPPIPYVTHRTVSYFVKA
jgi:hypothetical protein